MLDHLKIFPIILFLGLIITLVIISCNKDEKADEFSKFKINSRICENDQVPNCEKLPLGDNYFTTSKPAKGYLFSCSEQNSNAPGSLESEINWINFKENTWNFFEKLWLPKGTFNPGPGIYNETIDENSREITINNIPMLD